MVCYFINYSNDNKSSGILAQYRQLAATLEEVTNKESPLYLDLKETKNKALGITSNFIKFQEIAKAIEQKKDGVSLSECLRIINALEKQLYSMWLLSDINSAIQNPPTIFQADIKTLLYHVQTLKKTMLYEMKSNEKLMLPTDYLTQKALDEIAERDTDLARYRMLKINKKATGKLSDKVKELTQHQHEGMHTVFETIGSLLENYFSANENDLKKFLAEYQKQALVIAKGSTNKLFLETLQKINTELKDFVEQHRFLYENADRHLGRIQGVENAISNQLTLVEEKKIKSGIDVVNTVVYGKGEHDKKTIKSSGEAYKEQATILITDDTDYHIALVKDALKTMCKLALVKDEVELKEESGKGDLLGKGAKAGAAKLFDLTLGEVPWFGKIISAGLTKISEMSIDKVSEKLKEKTGRADISEEKEQAFIRLITHPELKIDMLAKSFVHCLFATYPDAFARMQFISKEASHEIMEKLAATMLLMMPHFADELTAEFQKNTANMAQKYQKMGLVLVDAFSAGCSGRLALQAMIKQWNVPLMVDGKIEEVNLFDVFTKCGLVASPSYIQKNSLGMSDGELIVYAPENNGDTNAIDVKKFGFRYTTSDNDQFDIGFENSCLRENRGKNGELVVSDPNVTYQGVMNDLQSHQDPYRYTVVPTTKEALKTESEKESRKPRRTAITNRSMNTTPAPTSAPAPTSTSATPIAQTKFSDDDNSSNNRNESQSQTKQKKHKHRQATMIAHGRNSNLFFNSNTTTAPIITSQNNNILNLETWKSIAAIIGKTDNETVKTALQNLQNEILANPLQDIRNLPNWYQELTIAASINFDAQSASSSSMTSNRFCQMASSGAHSDHIKMLLARLHQECIKITQSLPSTPSKKQ